MSLSNSLEVGESHAGGRDLPAARQRLAALQPRLERGYIRVRKRNTPNRPRSSDRRIYTDPQKPSWADIRMDRKMSIKCSIILIAVLLSQGLAFPGGCEPDIYWSCPGMTWVKTECNFIWSSEDGARITKSLKDLPPEIVAKLHEHLVKRLGRPFMSKLRFGEARIRDVDAYYREYPDWDRVKNPMPTYEVAYQVEFHGEGPVQYCAKIELDASGAVLEEIDLPAVAGNPKLGEVVPLQDIINLAHSLGVPTDKAYLDMKYNRRMGYLEYLVSYGPQDPPPEYNTITLYVRAHDPKEYFWFKSKLMSLLDPHERPNPPLNLTGAQSAPAG